MPTLNYFLVTLSEFSKGGIFESWGTCSIGMMTPRKEQPQIEAGSQFELVEKTAKSVVHRNKDQYEASYYLYKPGATEAGQTLHCIWKDASHYGIQYVLKHILDAEPVADPEIKKVPVKLRDSQEGAASETTEGPGKSIISI
jgi:hypothetical protein